LNSAAWRSQWRHSPSHHDHTIVHHSGYCESSFPGRLAGGCRAGCGCGPRCSARRGCTLFTLAFLSLAKQRIGSKSLICALNASIHLFWVGPGVSMPIADLPYALTYVGFIAIRMSTMSVVFTSTPFPGRSCCGCSCGGCCGCRSCGMPLTANPSRRVTMAVVDSCCRGRAAFAQVAHESGLRDRILSMT